MFYPQLAPTGVSSQLGRPRPFNPDAAQARATALRRRIEGEVRFDTGSRALYATDGSNYRQVPIGVVIPKSIEDVFTCQYMTRMLFLPQRCCHAERRSWPLRWLKSDLTGK